MEGRATLVPRLPRPAWVVLAGDAASAVGTGMSAPFMLVYFNRVCGIDMTVAGLAVSAIAAASFVGNLLGGWLGDRIGARDTLIAGLLVAGGGTACMPLVTEAWHAFAAAAAIGTGVSVVWPAQDALLARLVEPAQRSSAFSVRHATLNAGLAAGALAASTIVDLDREGTFDLLYLIDAATFVAFVPILLAGVANLRGADDGEEGAAGSYLSVFRDPVFVRIWLLVVLVVLIGYGQYHSAFPAFATRDGGISASALSLAYAANAAVVVLAQLFVLRALRGRLRTRALAGACCVWALAWAVVLAAGGFGGALPAVVLFATGMAVFGIGETLISPTFEPIVNDLAPEHLRGRYNGASTLAWTTGFLVAPALAAALLDAGMETELFLWLVGACLAAAGISLRLERHLPDQANVIG